MRELKTFKGLTSATAIAMSREMFREGVGWPLPLADVLEERDKKRSLRWILFLYQETLPTRALPHTKEQDEKWLQDLAAIIDRDDVRPYCEKMVYDVWYHDPEYNPFERGVSRLYGMLANWIEGDLANCRTMIGYAGSLLATDTEIIGPGVLVPERRRDSRTFELCLEVFLRFCDLPPSLAGTPPPSPEAP